MKRTAMIAITSSYPWPPQDGASHKLANLLTAWGDQACLIGPGPAASAPSGSEHRHSTGAPYQQLWIRSLVRAEFPVCRALPAKHTVALLNGALRETESGRAIVHLDTIASAHLARPLKAAFGDRIRVVASINDSVSLAKSTADKAVRFSALERYHAALFERFHLPSADVVHVVSNRDARWLRARFPDLRIAVVPIIVAPFDESEQASPRHDAIFVGSGTDAAGRWLERFLRGPLLEVKKRVPGFRFLLIAPRLDPSVADAAQSAGCSVSAYVEHRRLGSLIAGSAMMVVPSDQRSGTPTKALLAMDRKTPVIGGKVLEGIDGATSGTHYVRVYSEDSWAGALLRLHSDASLRTRIGDAARQLIDNRFRAHTVVERYLGSLEPRPN